MSQGARKFFSSFDLFSCIPSLRIRGQSELSSICGGVVSLLVMGFFIYVFVVDMVDMFNYGKIEAT